MAQKIRLKGRSGDTVILKAVIYNEVIKHV